jgi:para-nitrobenzyl esterase
MAVPPHLLLNLGVQIQALQRRRHCFELEIAMVKLFSIVLLLVRGIASGAALISTASAAPRPSEAPPPVPVVKTDGGSITGVTANGVSSFKGIPYAAPPVGALRWRVPQPAKSWPGVLAADKFGPACMQPDDVPKSEDCLTLNVWRPAGQPFGKLPVMVWIYGGALVHGRTAMYPLDAVVRLGGVAVSMNYRMGRLGFFAHPALAGEAPDDVQVDYGLMDQRAALQWVQRNIAAFGGDPSNVTIFGESAGGGSVMVHLTSPLSRGLFQRAILQSPGVPTARAKSLPISEIGEAEKSAVDYARSLGVTAEGKAALEALRAMPAAKLIEGASAKDEIAALSAGRHVAGFAGATRDGKLIVDTPEAVLAAGMQAMVPVMVGANDRDLPIGMARDKDELFAAFGAEAPAARKLYDPRGDQTLDELKQQVFADRTLVEPARHLADEMARAGQPTWLYRFAYVSEAQRGTNMGTLHGFEIPFTIDVPSAMVGSKVTATDKIMADTASAYWVQFAKVGDPNREGLPEWPRHNPAADRLLHFTNSGVVVGTDPLKPRLDLWRQIRLPINTAEPGASAKPAGIPVTIDNFIRAESDLYFSKAAFGKLRHARKMADIDHQDVVRMNRDTLYSSGVFDLKASPLTVTLPDPGKRFMSMQVISEDHYTTEVVYAPGTYSYTPEKVGTRYVYLIVRTLADPEDPADLKSANALQDQIKIEQTDVGKLELPDWDAASQNKVRDALNTLAALRSADTGAMFGAKNEVDPVAHLIGTAIGWGGNPRSAAIYRGVYPKENDGKTVYRLSVKDVPVDGFWSIGIYNAKGFFEKNELGRYSFNSITAKPEADGSFSVQFGDCKADTVNCLPIMPGWNYTVRLYRPRAEIVDGKWSFPEAKPAR